MGATKDLAIQLSEQYYYDSTFTKNDAKAQGIKLTKQILDSGNISPEEFTANLARLTEVLSNALATAKDSLHIDKEINVNGVKISHVQGGAIYDYAKDATWNHLNSKINKLKKDLKYREELLKQAAKSDVDVFDDDEIIEQVPVKGYRKSYIKLQF